MGWDFYREEALRVYALLRGWTLRGGIEVSNVEIKVKGEDLALANPEAYGDFDPTAERVSSVSLRAIFGLAQTAGTAPLALWFLKAIYSGVEETAVTLNSRAVDFREWTTFRGSDRRNFFFYVKGQATSFYG